MGESQRRVFSIQHSNHPWYEYEPQSKLSKIKYIPSFGSFLSEHIYYCSVRVSHVNADGTVTESIHPSKSTYPPTSNAYLQSSMFPMVFTEADLWKFLLCAISTADQTAFRVIWHRMREEALRGHDASTGEDAPILDTLPNDFVEAILESDKPGFVASVFLFSLLQCQKTHFANAFLRSITDERAAAIGEAGVHKLVRPEDIANMWAIAAAYLDGFRNKKLPELIEGKLSPMPHHEAFASTLVAFTRRATPQGEDHVPRTLAAVTVMPQKKETVSVLTPFLRAAVCGTETFVRVWDFWVEGRGTIRNGDVFLHLCDLVLDETEMGPLKNADVVQLLHMMYAQAVVDFTKYEMGPLSYEKYGWISASAASAQLRILSQDGLDESCACARFWMQMVALATGWKHGGVQQEGDVPVASTVSASETRHPNWWLELFAELRKPHAKIANIVKETHQRGARDIDVQRIADEDEAQRLCCEDCFVSDVAYIVLRYLLSMDQTKATKMHIVHDFLQTLEEQPSDNGSTFRSQTRWNRFLCRCNAEPSNDDPKKFNVVSELAKSQNALCMSLVVKAISTCWIPELKAAGIESMKIALCVSIEMLNKQMFRLLLAELPQNEVFEIVNESNFGKSVDTFVPYNSNLEGSCDPELNFYDGDVYTHFLVFLVKCGKEATNSAKDMRSLYGDEVAALVEKNTRQDFVNVLAKRDWTMEHKQHALRAAADAELHTFAEVLMCPPHSVPCIPDNFFLLNLSHELFKPGGRGFKRTQEDFDAQHAPDDTNGADGAKRAKPNGSPSP